MEMSAIGTIAAATSVAPIFVPRPHVRGSSDSFTVCPSVVPQGGLHPANATFANAKRTHSLLFLRTLYTRVMTAVQIETPVSTERAKRTRRLGMRWKLLIAFGLVFTVFFVVLAVWILQFSTNSANNRLRSTLRQLSEGGAQTVDGTEFAELAAGAAAIKANETYPGIAGVLAGQVTTDPAQCGGDKPVFTSCYPASEIYWRHINALVNIRRTSPDAYPYSYGVDSSGKLVFIGSYGAYGVSEDRKTLGVGIPRGAKYLQGLEAIIDAKTLEYFKEGLTATTFQPAYTDTLGRWISVYTPIKDKAGKVVGAIGVDYKISYVAKVRRDVQRSLYPVFIVAYVLLLGLVFVLSGQFAKRISRLNSVTRKVAEGDYDVDISSSASAVFSDEMTELANSFLTMTKKVGDRERTLTQTVQVLRVEIDEAKRKDAVSEIIDSDFFNDLTKKAGAMRAKVKGAEIVEASAERENRTGSSDE